MNRTEDIALEISTELQQALLLYRLQRGVHVDPSLPSDVVSGVEDALGGILLPADILATFAATGRDLYDALVWTRDARDSSDVFAEYLVVGIDRYGAETRRWCARVGPRRSSAQPRPTSPTSLFRWPTGRRSDPLQTFSVAQFVRTSCHLTSPSHRELVAVEGLRRTFAPRLLAKTARRARSVWHPRFGRGIVVREVREHVPKLEVDFGDLGCKLVPASYVSDHPKDPLLA